jgi:hypothetical protein
MMSLKQAIHGRQREISDRPPRDGDAGGAAP